MCGILNIFGITLVWDWNKQKLTLVGSVILKNYLSNVFFFNSVYRNITGRYLKILKGGGKQAIVQI